MNLLRIFSPQSSDHPLATLGVGIRPLHQHVPPGLSSAFGSLGEPVPLVSSGATRQERCRQISACLSACYAKATSQCSAVAQLPMAAFTGTGRLPFPNWGMAQDIDGDFPVLGGRERGWMGLQFTCCLVSSAYCLGFGVLLIAGLDFANQFLGVRGISPSTPQQPLLSCDYQRRSSLS